MKIEIKNTIGTPIITFSNFKKGSIEPFIFINFLTSVNINGFEAKSNILVELTDISEMLANLKVLNESLKRIFFFQHNDKYFTIKFEPNTTGQIMITGNLRSEDYSSRLEFKFEMGQELLPELINQCEEVVNRFTKDSQIDKYLYLNN